MLCLEFEGVKQVNEASVHPFRLPCGSIYRATVIPTDSGTLWAIRNDPSPQSTLLSLRNGDSETTATRILSSPIFSILYGFLQGFGGAARRGCTRLRSAGRVLSQKTRWKPMKTRIRMARMTRMDCLI